MSTIADNVTATYRRQLAGDLGDSISYTPDGAAAETINAQIEPWSQEQEAADGAQMDQVETIITVIVGTSAGDVSAAAIGDTCVFGGRTWSVMRMLSRWGQTGIARMIVASLARTALAGQDVLRPGAQLAGGGRFGPRGGG